MALDFLTGLMMSLVLISMLPKIELRLPTLSLPDTVGLVTDPDNDWNGVNAGASGLNLGPEVEKLKSLWPGEKDGASPENFGVLPNCMTSFATGGISGW